MNDKRKDLWVAALVGLPFVILLGLLAAPYWGTNLFVIIQGLAASHSPFRVPWCGVNSLRMVATFCGIYAMVCLYAWASIRNTRYGSEHGSANWGNPRSICHKLQDANFSQNRLFTTNVRIGHNFHKHRRNLNVCIVGGSGAAKTRGYVMPNLMQANSSYVVTDPKGENLMGCGQLLTDKGVKVKVLDLLEMQKSSHYNPFHYMRNENDVQLMVTFLFSATTPNGAQSSDPFWDKAAESLLMAFCFYLWMEAPEEEQNFGMVMELLHCAAPDDTGSCITDALFDALAEKKPDHLALKYYTDFRGSPAKTKGSIRMVLATHLDKFNLPEVADLTSRDDLELRKLGEEKTALFLRISDSDKSFNFIVSMLYIQVIQQLFESADLQHGGSLPVHVHFLMDEFANIALPDDFGNHLSTMRSRNISASIILQAISQMKNLYKDNRWESIIGNCDEFLYLGGNEQSTHEYVSKALGKETIWTRSNSLSKGRSGNYSRSDQTSGRELLTPDEVRSLDNNHCILLIRGYDPIYDLKYDLTTHPNYKRTKMGGARPYIHGQKEDTKQPIPAEPDRFEFFDPDEVPGDLS